MSFGIIHYTKYNFTSQHICKQYDIVKAHFRCHQYYKAVLIEY